MKENNDYSPKNHIKTMIEELDNLLERTNGFECFINSPDFKKRIPDTSQQNLALKQLQIMKDYCEVLSERIEYFENKSK